MGAGRDHDRAWARNFLKTGRQIGRLAGHRSFLRCAFADHVADHHRPGGDADADGDILFQTRDSIDHGEAGVDGALGIVFVGMGIANTSSKAFVEAHVPDVQTTYIGVLFAVAAVGGLLCFLSPVWRANLTGVREGVTLGLVIVVSIVSYLVALEELAGVVVFPIQAAGLILNTIFAVWVWNERFSNRTIVGMGIALLGLIVVNVK